MKIVKTWQFCLYFNVIRHVLFVLVKTFFIGFTVLSTTFLSSIDLAHQNMNKWLIKRRIDADKISCYVNVMKQCRTSSSFTTKFSNRLNMRSCLSPFIANVFMRTFEINLFPRIWLRYVDDIFAVTKGEKVNET
jgi:hypothetical protein